MSNEISKPGSVEPKPLPNQVVRTTTQMVASMHSGPLPSPNDLAAYEKILPGAAERIFALTEGETKHRRDMERTIVAGNLQNERTGMRCGLLVAVLVVVASVVMAALKQPVPASIFGVGGIGSLLTVFVKGRKQATEERKVSEAEK